MNASKIYDQFIDHLSEVDDLDIEYVCYEM